jgi:hypothetical protein
MIRAVANTRIGWPPTQALSTLGGAALLVVFPHGQQHCGED